MLFKAFIPYATAKSIYDIDIDFYLKHGVKYLLSDLDNTLDSYKLFEPTAKAIQLMKRLKENNIELVVVSNNRGKRVSSYAKALGADYISSARKPFPFRLNHYIEKRGLKRNEIMFVGDQMMTDVLATHFAKINMILTDKIVKEDQWTTHINRIFGRRIKKYHLRRGNLKDWRTL